MLNRGLKQHRAFVKVKVVKVALARSIRAGFAFGSLAYVRIYSEMAALVKNLLRRVSSTAVGTRKLTNLSVGREVLGYFQELPQTQDHVMVTYVWIDGTGEHLRCKTKIVDRDPSRASECPEWNYDGSSTYQAQGHDSDVSLVPVRMFPDPFNRGKHKMVLCETFDSSGKATDSNHRSTAREVLDQVKDKDPWFGLEQEYTLLDKDGWPYGWPKNAFLGPQGPYYCAVGGSKIFGRDIVEAHVRACMYAGIKICGTNAEVMPSQWEYQIGPLGGIEFGDQLWMSRYILHRIAEIYGVEASFDPKPIKGDWNGAGGHVNFCFTDFRSAPSGIDAINEAIKRLKKRHDVHIQAYDPQGGQDNARRLTGQHETAHIGSFTAGTAHRGASVRIPRHVSENKKGYLEDRRPSSNCDPYKVAEIMTRTCILGEE